MQLAPPVARGDVKTHSGLYSGLAVIVPPPETLQGEAWPANYAMKTAGLSICFLIESIRANPCRPELYQAD
ncbi:hypothetical protein BH09PLA1_BH09PLA1_19780 [soil metagenome]